MKILIGGAGIAGLAIGWRLAMAGASIAILDRGQAGQGATWASAGMLAPGAEFASDANAVSDFARQSLGAWPRFAAELEAASGVTISYRACGTLIVADSAAAAERLRRQAGDTAAFLSPREALTREPLLSPSIAGALFVPGDAQVDNRALGPALAIAAKRAGARIAENCTIRALAVADGRVRGVVTEAGLVDADAVVLALGAWMNCLDIDASVLPPVNPTKGQMVALSIPAGLSPPRALVWSDDVYIVPRRDRVMLGATVEDAGFDLSVTREASDRLCTAAARIMPALEHAAIAEAWAGLRPRTPDAAPVLGETGIAGLYVAGGQFRNGILFAPLVAERLAAIILHKEQPASEFDPKRFACA